MLVNSDEIKKKKSQMIEFHPPVWLVVRIIHFKGIVGRYSLFSVWIFLSLAERKSNIHLQEFGMTNDSHLPK